MDYPETVWEPPKTSKNLQKPAAAFSHRFPDFFITIFFFSIFFYYYLHNSENLPETAVAGFWRFPADFRVIHHWRTIRYIMPSLIYVIDGSSSSTTCWRQARATWMSMWSGFPFRQPSHKPKQASFSNCLDLTSCFWNDLENEQRTILPHVLIRKTKNSKPLSKTMKE